MFTQSTIADLIATEDLATRGIGLFLIYQSRRKHRLTNSKCRSVQVLWEKQFISYAVNNLFTLDRVTNEGATKDKQERVQLIKFIRTTLDGAGLSKTPIVAGVGASSTRETIALAQSAARAGA